MYEPILLKNKGGKWFHTDDYHSPNLSKASLGLFFYEVLKIGAYVGQVWPFATYPRSSVFLTVFMTEEMKNELEIKFPFKFKNPPIVKANHE